MKQKVAWRRHCMSRSATDLAKRMKLRRARLPEKPVPRVRPNSHDAGERRFNVAILHRAENSAQVSAERTQRRESIVPAFQRRHQKDRRARKRRHNRLRHHMRRFRRILRGQLHVLSSWWFLNRAEFAQHPRNSTFAPKSLSTSTAEKGTLFDS